MKRRNILKCSIQTQKISNYIIWFRTTELCPKLNSTLGLHKQIFIYILYMKYSITIPYTVYNLLKHISNADTCTCMPVHTFHYCQVRWICTLDSCHSIRWFLTSRVFTWARLGGKALILLSEALRVLKLLRFLTSSGRKVSWFPAKR